MPRAQLFEVDGHNPPRRISKLFLRYRRSIAALKKDRIAYRHPALSSSRHAALPCIASRRPFIAPPSRRLIMPDGCCVDSRRAAVSSTHRAALSAIERPPHRRHCTPFSPSTAATAAATCVVERFTLVH